MSTEMRARWARAAAGWEEYADFYRRTAMPVSTWMIDAIAPQPGHTILELAAGIGDTGFLAAELIRPGGTLICSDIVPEMLSAAQRRAERLGIRNVRFRQIDAQRPIDQAAASLDAVLCRWGFMLMDDPDAALKETRRVLKPEARLALAAWAAREENPGIALPMDELLARGLVEPPDPSAPGQFTWAPEGVIAEHLEAAGFGDPEVAPVELTFRYDSIGAWWATGTAMTTSIRDADSAMDDDLRAAVHAALARAAAPFTAQDGSLAIPARTWVAAATA
jgi:SAM-dependent methyltransferase